MSKIHGKATIRVNGNFVETYDDASLIPGGVKNNERSSSTGFNYNQTFRPAEIVCKVPVKKDTSLRSLVGLADIDVTFESDVGTTYLVKNAAQVGEAALGGGSDGGSIELTFNGDPAEEISA